MVVAGGHDEHLAVGQIHLHVRNPDPVEEHPPLTPHELDRVGRERLQLVSQPRLGLDERIGHRIRGLRDTLGEHLLPRVEHPLVHTHPDAVLDRVQHLGTDRVDQRDPRVDEDLRPQVGETPGDRRGRVDDRHHGRGDQRVRGRPIEIDLIEHRDVARPQPPQQRAGVPVDPRDTTDPRQLGPGAMQQPGEPHARTMTSGATSARQGTPKLTERDRSAGPGSATTLSAPVGKAGDTTPATTTTPPTTVFQPTGSAAGGPTGDGPRGRRAHGPGRTAAATPESGAAASASATRWAYAGARRGGRWARRRRHGSPRTTCTGCGWSPRRATPRSTPTVPTEPCWRCAVPAARRRVTAGVRAVPDRPPYGGGVPARPDRRGAAHRGAGHRRCPARPARRSRCRPPRRG